MKGIVNNRTIGIRDVISTANNRTIGIRDVISIASNRTIGIRDVISIEANKTLVRKAWSKRKASVSTLRHEHNTHAHTNSHANARTHACTSGIRVAERQEQR